MLLDDLFMNDVATLPPDISVVLYVFDPSDATTLQEASYKGYARQKYKPHEPVHFPKITNQKITYSQVRFLNEQGYCLYRYECFFTLHPDEVLSIHLDLI